MTDSNVARAGKGAAPEEAFVSLSGNLSGGLLILCDHATRKIPPEYAELGMPQAELERHIAYDIGVGPLTEELAERLDAPAILTQFSRLIIDPNRGEDDPTLIMRISDGALVPGNRGVDAAERERRLDRFYRPYHRTVEETIDAMVEAGRPPVIFSVHSFTPVWKGMRRPWHAGILWDKDPRLALPLLDLLRAEHGLRVGDNEPYTGALLGDTLNRHGTQRGLAHALIEVRNDLIARPAGVAEWAERLEAILREVLKDEALYEMRQYGSHSDDAP
ncbi:N-formylglutamate amidohydrolase [Afifella sp. IM 167]|uniref:N-formylglutamate amidohydrolase n=1 Tax=Afifella sp. IM 167 TaxID=2033586 RepID=UPI001CCF5614|nr:N-formylglutamate amidohydrolase [Afifella sp. IM 167]MBZ8135338.1 N-formylglutamate amidohydrolase [Afifella sp. IM 167]